MNSEYDVVIIGGGPAGMMCAGRAAERGHSVLLLEKNPTLGKKLLITGGGRCNITNNKIEVREMLSKYKGNDQFLFSAFMQFNVKDTIEFFTTRGVALKEENEGRMFPVTDSAKSVFDVLVQYMKKGGVKVKTGAEVTGISIEVNTKYIIVSVKGQEPARIGYAEGVAGGDIIAKSCVVAVGGTSRPETGSTGEGFKWLKGLGHTIIENDLALVPLALADAWAKKIGGITLKDVKLTTFQNGQKQTTQKGGVVFTHFGISGPAVLNMSREVGDLLKYGKVSMEIDLFPTIDSGVLRKQLQELLAGESNKKLRNVLGKLIPSALALALLEVAKIDGETKNNLVSAESRKKLVLLMKAIPLSVSNLMGSDRAVISSGGVALPEVNFKTMQSRIIPNIYLVGDVLNIDRPSGGYSLQLCWTTGFVAGNNI